MKNCDAKPKEEKEEEKHADYRPKLRLLQKE